MYDELAAAARSVAAGVDLAAVQLDQALTSVSPMPSPPLRAPAGVGRPA